MPVLAPSDLERLAPVFRGRAGRALGRALMRLTGVSKVNDLYDRVAPLKGPAFADGILKDVGVDYRIGNPSRLQNLPEGPFITVSNHIYGHLDGIMLVDLMGHLRPGFKVMVNEILGHIRMMAENFIVVNPTGSERVAATPASISGVREALATLRDGAPLGLFPSGAVSDLSIREGFRIRDRQWQEAALKLIRKAGVPVIPVRFFDRNSDFYYSLGLIDYRLRLMRLCHEVFNKRGKTVRLGIGPVISVEEQAAAADMESFGRLLRSAVYDMPVPEEWALRSELSL